MEPVLSFHEASVKKTQELFAFLKTSAGGLHEEDAEDRLRSFGPNAVHAKRVTWREIAMRQFRSAFIILLFVAAAIALALREFLDAGMIFLFLCINASIGFAQEFHAERSLVLLRQFVRRTCQVRRNGMRQTIPVENVVPGDIVLLSAGDAIPADGVFIRSENLTVDESPLTGESVPAEKSPQAPEQPPASPPEARNIGFSQTTVMSGDAELVVFATGNRTEVGKIAVAAEETETQSAFEIGIGRFSRFVLRLVFLTAPLVFAANAVIRGESFAVAEFLIFTIALIVSVIPEALPLVTTISMTRGALRLARKNVIPRRLSAIEDLGSIDVLCTDKTGTITENRLTVVDTFGERDEVLLLALSAASLPGETPAENVFDAALRRAAPQDLRERSERVERLKFFPFDPVRRRESVVIAEEGRRALIVRGAPEALATDDSPDRKEELRLWVSEQGKRGRRVLAIAKGDLPPAMDIQRIEEEKTPVKIIGAVAFADPLKTSAEHALRQAERLGVRVKILTGDSGEVAGWIAKEVGLVADARDVLTGDAFERLSPAGRREAAERYDVFARTTPLQKYAILETLKEKHLVGFLGEGFNDAPALKLAHVALAVEGASDIAQDASDIVLRNRSLDVIVDGIRIGREVFANTIKYIKATLTSNFGNFYALAFASLIVADLPMLPVQILLLNLLSDLPMISIAADSVDERELQKPRGYHVRELAIVALVLGLISTGFDFAFFGFFVRYGVETLQTMWFLGSLLTELVLFYSIRTQLPFSRAKAVPSPINMLTGGVAAAAIILPFTTLGQRIFFFVRPERSLLLTVFALVVVYFASTEIVKLWIYRWLQGRRADAE